MKYDATGQRGPRPPAGTKVYDLDTGEEVRKVIWIDWDPATGEGTLEAFVWSELTGFSRFVGNDGKLYEKTYTAKGRFRVGVPTVGDLLPEGSGPLPQKIIMGAPQCAKCRSPLTLPGDDLCPVCRAKERGQKHPMRVDRIDDPVSPHKCEKCSRQALWCVSDEVETTPSPLRGVELPNGKKGVAFFDRGATVGRRYYCPSHYQPPRELDSKGEVVRELEEESLARPA